VLIVTTADEHRVALAMLRIALGLTPEQVEQITGSEAGWVIGWEGGTGPHVSLEHWQSWVRTLAVAYTAKLHAEAEPAALRDLAASLVQLADKKARR